MMSHPFRAFVAAALAVWAALPAMATGKNEEPSAAARREKLVFLTNINVDTEKYDVNDNPYVRYIEERNNVDLEIINEASSQYNQKASTIIASGDLPDYLMITTTLRTNFSIWAKDGLLVPLDDYIKNTRYLKVDMLPLSWEVSKIDGKIFGIPMQRYDASPRMPFARKAWLEKLGASPDSVKTIDDWQKLLRDFTEKDPDGNGRKDTFGMTGMSSATDEFPLYTFLDSFGAAKSRIVEGKVLPNYVLPEYREWLKFMNGLYKAGILDPEYLVNTKQQYWEKIVSGRIGAFYHFWSIQEFTGLKGNREDLVSMKPPLRRDGSAAGNINVMPVRHWIAVTKKAKNPAKIVSLMDWAFSDEGGTFVHAGVEGMDYDLKDGKVVIKPDRKGKSWAWRFITLGIQKTKMDDQLQYLLQQSWGDLGLRHLKESAQYGTFDEIPMLAPPFPSLADYDLTAQRDEFKDKAIIGTIHIDAEWDSFVAKWRKSGGDEWIKLHTDWYNSRK